MFTLGARELLIGLGSNAEGALTMLRRARAKLRATPGLTLKHCSPIYQSDALLPEGAPRDWDRPFLNAVCLMEVQRDALDSDCARELIGTLKALERTLAREEAPRWAPRAIDLDLLAWDGPSVSEPGVTIPHPGLHERPFALLPASDCLGDRLGVPDLAPAPWRWGPVESVPLRTQRTENAWPELVGILNLTPDSFSDGAPHPSPETVCGRVEELAAGGATVIDLGAESTRPGAAPITPEEEWRRLSPYLDGIFSLRSRLGFVVSLDSRNAETVARVLRDFPLDWVNDVEGFEAPTLASLAARSGCRLVVMHSLGVPPTADRTLDPTRDPLEQVLAWGRRKLEKLGGLGVPPERIVLDPGIGFGKTPAQNLELLERVDELHALGVSLLVGHSRKRFLDPSSRMPADERDLETALVTARLARSGVDYLRVHAPAVQGRALKLGARLWP